MRKALSIIAIVATSMNAAAQETSARPYAFSGACSSQGLWTQEALQITQQIRGFTAQLKNDPSCQALGNKLQASLNSLANNVSPQVTEKYSHRLTELPQEISALRQALSGDQTFKQLAQKAITQKTFENAIIAASTVNSAPATSAATDVATAVIAPEVAAMQALGRRFSRASQDGLAIFNDVIDTLPAMQECLTNDGQATGQILAASVKLLTSFAASGQDSTGSSLATALSKLTDVMRNQKFAKVFRTLNQADFLSSMACLVEMTSENYCSTRDSKMLFDEMMKQLRVRPRAQEMERLGPSHALAGYYILTQNLPMITNWIQRVQIGVDPRVPTDAIFQNSIFDDVNNFFKKVKDLQGTLSKDVEAMKVIQDLKGRQNQARQIILKVSNIISGNRGFGSDQSGVNFFTLNASGQEMMFNLMGIPVPDEVLGKGTAAQPPDLWIDNNYASHPLFNDPDALIQRVQKNLNEMIRTANTNAIDYYQKWFIVDKISLVNESFLGFNYDVKTSFTLVSQYLLEVEKRLRAHSQDLSLIGGIQETRVKIRNVMNAYKKLEEVSKKLQAHNENLSQDERDEILAANVAIITSVYDEFEILLGKSGWFSNRIVKFVYADYVNLLKQKGDFGGTIEDLAYASGLGIFDQILATANNNPAKVENDLANALRINKMNIEAIELLIRDHFAATTAELKAVNRMTEGKTGSFSANRTNISSAERIYQDSLIALPGEDHSQTYRTARALGKTALELFKSAVPWLDMGNPKYAANNDRFAVDDEFGSSKRMFEQFCIQSLAFSDVRSFYRLCKDVFLKSPFSDSFLADLDEKQKTELSVTYAGKLTESRENAALNYSKRICAFRDYNRKNLVMYLTSSAARGNSK